MIPRFRYVGVGLVLFVLLSSLGSYASKVVSADISPYQAPVQGAEDAVGSAFVAVLGAEKAGANVSALRVELNSAVDLLSQAKVQLRDGNGSGAVGTANSSIALAGDVILQASSLEASTLADHESSFMLSLVIYPVGIVVFLSLLVLFWRRFRRHYVRRIMDMRPVVVSDAEA